MNKLALLPLLALSACAASGENARLTQTAMAHDEAVCIDRGNQPGTVDYLRCMAKLGQREGYHVAEIDSGQINFTLPAPVLRQPPGPPGWELQYGARPD